MPDKSTALFWLDDHGHMVDAWIWDELLDGDPPPAPGDPYFHDAAQPHTLAAATDTPVHAAADRHVPALRTALLTVFTQVQHTIDLQALGKPLAVQAVLMDVPELLAAGLSSVLPERLFRVVIDGGRAGMAMLGSMRAAEFRVAKKKFTLSFNVIDPRAIAWAKEYAGELIKGIVETTRAAIADAVVEGLSGEASRKEVIDDILAAIGDAARADLIAHTETMRAANTGLAKSWQQAQEKGWLSGDARKRWIAAGDGPPPYGSTCDICLGLNGETVKINESFSVGDDPPAHPNCRCTMGIVG